MKTMFSPDTTTILSINIGAIGISLTGVELALKLMSLGLAIGYTVWKWRKDSKEK